MDGGEEVRAAGRREVEPGATGATSRGALVGHLVSGQPPSTLLQVAAIDKIADMPDREVRARR